MHSQLPRIIITLLITTAWLTGCSREDDTVVAQDYLKRANAYTEQRQYRAAMIEVTNALNSDPDDVRYPIALAEIYNTLGAGRRASSLLEGYLDEHRREVALPLANAYLMQGKFLSAKETLEGFTPTTEQETRKLALYEADIQRTQGNLEASEAAYQALLEAYPGDLEIALRLAENHIFRKQNEAAEQLLSQLREQYPQEPEPLHLSAIVALQSNDLERAERLLTDALIHMPDSDVMLPDRAAVLQLLSETLTARGRTAEALVYQKALAEQSPETVAAQQRLREATSAVEAGNYEKAETILQELLSENPDSQSAALLLGMVSLSQGDFGSAEPLLTRSVDVETANTEVIRATVMAQARSGNAEQAIQTLQRSLKARPDDPILLSLYGILALNDPELEREGYLSLQKALAKDPHRGGLRLALARYHFQRDEIEQGTAQLRTAFSYQPADWAVTNVYINQLLAQGALRELKSVVATLKEAAPKAPETSLYEAQYRFREGDQQGGIRQLEQLLNTEPAYARGHGVLAQMYFESGQLSAALDSVERVIELEPQNNQALQAGVQMIVASNGPESPQEWLASVGANTPAADPNATALTAMLYREEGDLEQATQLMTQYDGDETPYIQQVKSVVYRDRALQLAGNGEYERARALLSQALETFPTSRTLSLDLVRLELAQGRLEQAKVLLDDLQARHPGDPEVVIMRARWAQAAEGDTQAYQVLNTAWEERPSSEIAVALLPLAQKVAPDTVPQILQTWEETESESRARLLYVADRYQQQGDERAAIATYEQLLTNNPSDPVALNNLAWLLKDRDLERALSLAEQAATAQPNSAAILDTYGWLLHLNGDKEAALTQLQRAVELAPEVPSIQENLQTVRKAQ